MQLSNVAYVRVETPLGVFVVAARDAALKGGWFEGQKYFPEISADAGWREEETAILRTARQQLKAYFAGDTFRGPAGTGRHSVPAPGVGCAARSAVR